MLSKDFFRIQDEYFESMRLYKKDIEEYIRSEAEGKVINGSTDITINIRRKGEYSSPEVCISASTDYLTDTVLEGLYRIFGLQVTYMGTMMEWNILDKTSVYYSDIYFKPTK